MHICFIKPGISSEKSSAVMEPLEFAILNAYTPVHHTREFYDERIEDIPMEINPDLVAINVETFSAARAYHWAKHFGARGCTVVFGGFHATALPDEVLEYGHSVVIGNAETQWPVLLADLENNALKPKYIKTPQGGELHTRFDRSIFKGKKYNYVIPVQWGRGCKHNCGFCSIQSFFQGTLAMRPLSDVIQEIRMLPTKTLFMVDDNLFYSPQKLKDFCTAIKPMKRKWGCQISADVARHPELVTIMAQSGCILAFIGIESLDSDTLKSANKSWNMHNNNVVNAIKLFKRNGIMLYGSFIFGFEKDTIELFDQTVDFAIRHKFFIANFNLLYPMPGTQLYFQLRDANQLTDNFWWKAPGFQYGYPMVRPSHMTTEEFGDGVFNAKKKFISWRSILYRLTDRRTHLSSLLNFFLYLTGNIINRREIYKKQFQVLGK